MCVHALRVLLLLLPSLVTHSLVAPPPPPLQVSRHVRVPIGSSHGKFQTSITDAQSKIKDALALFGPAAQDPTHKLIKDMGA